MHRTPQGILPHGTDGLVSKAEWMVNNVDYLHYQGKTNSTVTYYVETYTQFHVQKLPEHGNYYPQCICTHGTDGHLFQLEVFSEDIPRAVL